VTAFLTAFYSYAEPGTRFYVFDSTGRVPWRFLAIPWRFLAIPRLRNQPKSPHRTSDHPITLHQDNKSYGAIGWTHHAYACTYLEATTMVPTFLQAPAPRSHSNRLTTHVSSRNKYIASLVIRGSGPPLWTCAPIVNTPYVRFIKRSVSLPTHLYQQCNYRGLIKSWAYIMKL
jgi:hypothetical protein